MHMRCLRRFTFKSFFL
uniref:Coliphage gene of unknown function n=1 Tax=Enterobacteria phage R17 TaxID=12026 RepID=Q37853_BPR17|nr:unnamed protein product [Enterobacteria phage R17]